MADLIDPTVSFANGFKAAQASADAFRSARAANALRAAYGPAVQSFADAKDQQDISLNDQLNPLKVQAAQEANQFNAQLDPLKIQEQQNVNTTGQQQIDTNAMSIQATKATQLHGVLSASLDNLGNQLKGVTDPNQRGALFDAEVQHVAPLIGADPRVIAAQLRDERERIMHGGADALPQIQSELDGLIMGQLSPVDRQKLLNNQAVTDANVAKIGAQTDLAKANTAKATAQTAAATAKAKGTADPAATAVYQEGLQNGLAQIQAMRQHLQNMTGIPTLAQLQSNVPGFDAYNFKHGAERVGNLMSDIGLKSMKALGVSLGKTSNVEFQAEAKAFSNLDIGQGKEVLKKQLDDAEAMIKRAMAAAGEAQGQAGASAGTTPAGTSGEASPGQDAGQGDVVDYSTYFGGQ